jgi:hypothetical protein
MAGIFTGKVLAEGQLPNAKGTLYTVPGSTKAYVKFFSAENVGSGTEAVRIYLKPGSTSRGAGRATLQPGEHVRFVDKDEAMILEAGDLIEGHTTSTAAVDYLILGLEET